MELKIDEAPELEALMDTAVRDIKLCMGKSRGGCRGAAPAARGYEHGIWLCDALWTFVDALVYMMKPAEARRYLYSRRKGAVGVIPFFTALQEKSGKYAGNIPVAKRFLDKFGVPAGIDYGGMFDYAYKPRKNNRDDWTGSFLMHAMHAYWKHYADDSFIREYYDVMEKYMRYWINGLDGKTGLYKSSYGLGDLCFVPHAAERACALPLNNAHTVRMLLEFAEMAKAAGKAGTGAHFERRANRITKGVNRLMWDGKSGHFKAKMFSGITTDTGSALYGMKEDGRFHVAGDMTLLYFGLARSRSRVERLVHRIEAVDGRRGVYGTSIEPPYKDDEIYPREGTTPHLYWNGDIWPCFGGWYAHALFELGYTDIAMKVLRKMAKAVIRDKGFHEFYEATRMARGRGAFHYAYTAAPYIRALAGGLFGLSADYTRGIVCIRPVLMNHGSLSCRLGGYEFQVEFGSGRKVSSLVVTTDYRGEADIRLPVGRAAHVCFMHRLEKGKNSFECSWK